MVKEREIDETIVDWISKFVDYLKNGKQQILTFLARRIAFERWLVLEFGFCRKDKVKGVTDLLTEREVFFELGRKFDLVICPPEKLREPKDLLKYLEEKNGVVMEFKTGTYDKEGNLTSNALVKGVENDVRKLKKYEITYRYIIGFLYGLSGSKEKNPFIRGPWLPLMDDAFVKEFNEMKQSVKSSIEKIKGIQPLRHNQNLDFDFRDNNISGKGAFLVYKVKKRQ